MNVREFGRDYFVEVGTTLCETALTGVSAIPASGGYWDVSMCDYVHVVGHLGTIHPSDSPTFELQCAEAADGTLDAISATALKFTPAVTDDGQMIMWDIKVDTLPADHHYLGIAVAGTLTNGSYADFMVFKGRLSIPVSQSATQISSSAIMRWLS